MISGSVHLANLVISAKSVLVEEEDFKIFKQAFLSNNYFSHSELVILALLADKDQEKRRLGVNLILEAREEYRYDPANLRKFRKPKEKDINFEASDYSNLLNYETFEGKLKSFLFLLSFYFFTWTLRKFTAMVFPYKFCEINFLLSLYTCTLLCS